MFTTNLVEEDVLYFTNHRTSRSNLYIWNNWLVLTDMSKWPAGMATAWGSLQRHLNRQIFRCPKISLKFGWYGASCWGSHPFLCKPWFQRLKKIQKRSRHLTKGFTFFPPSDLNFFNPPYFFNLPPYFFDLPPKAYSFGPPTWLDSSFSVASEAEALLIWPSHLILCIWAPFFFCDPLILCFQPCFWLQSRWSHVPDPPSLFLQPFLLLAWTFWWYFFNPHPLFFELMFWFFVVSSLVMSKPVDDVRRGLKDSSQWSSETV